jgi:CRP/FNR family transcriptional regulator, cyclic AMP receptor protein
MDGYDRALVLTYLEQVPTFGACSARELEHLLDLAELTAFEAGTELVHEGDLGSDFFLVAQGEVVVERRGREVARLGPGGFFGELALFDEAPRNASVIAASGAALAVFTRDRFRQALDDLPALRDSLLRGMARRLHELDARP